MVLWVTTVSSNEVGKSAFEIRPKLPLGGERWLKQHFATLIVVKTVDVLFGGSPLVAFIKKHLANPDDSLAPRRLNILNHLLIDHLTFLILLKFCDDLAVRANC